MTASLTTYPAVTSGAALATVFTILDPCDDPFGLTQPPTQTAPADYLYTADSPLLTFSTSPFTVDPSVCPIAYSCVSTVAPAGLDLCNFTDTDANAVFDPVTGSYTLNSIDMVLTPPGTYTLEITGSSGAKSVSFTVDLVLVDPCSTVDL